MIVQGRTGESLHFAVILPNRCIAAVSASGTNVSESTISASQKIWRLWKMIHSESVSEGLSVIQPPRVRFTDGSSLALTVLLHALIFS